jgi:hypothetical protein
VAIPGLCSVHRNEQAQQLKEDQWQHLLRLLGKHGQDIMIDLLLDHAIFSQVKTGQQNFQQLSGSWPFSIEVLDLC